MDQNRAQIKMGLSMRMTVIGFLVLVSLSENVFATDFYRSKTIRIIVGNPVGGGFDLHARLVARHIGNHLPGNPNVLIANMPGAGGIAAANHLFQVAKPDGLTIGVWNPGLVLRQLLGDGTSKFESDRFRWIGSVTKTTEACAIMGFRGPKKWEEIRVAKDPITMAATVAGAGTHYLPALLRSATGANLQIVSGYGGTAAIISALQRREAHGACWNWESMTVIAKHMLNAEGVDKLIPFMLDRKPDSAAVSDITLFRDVLLGEHLKVYDALTAHTSFFYPLVAPPNTSGERLVALRRSFNTAMNDPRLIVEAKRTGLTTDYTTGEEVESLIFKLTQLEPTIVENLQSLLGLKR